MRIIKAKKYKKDLQKNIVKKYKITEEKTIKKIEELIIQSENMKELILNPLSKIYKIEKKKRGFKVYIYC